MNNIQEMYSGFGTAFINSNINSNLAYRPEFVSNNPDEGKKVLSSIEEELLHCDSFRISVAFITMGGITPLLQTLKELEEKGIQGQILTTNYLDFSEPRALEKLHELKNIALKMYDAEAEGNGFHTKGYIFKKEEVYRFIIGSSNLTGKALTCSREWNTRLLSTEEGELAGQILEEFEHLWNSAYSKNFEDFYEEYRVRYAIVRSQKEAARQEEIPSIEKYRLRPNSMQASFIANLKKLIDKGEERALLVASCGTGKTFASAFAVRELGFKHVLFVVHRGQLARQTRKSYKKILPDKAKLGLVGDGCCETDADYIFATVQTLSKDEYIKQFDPNQFDCIILDEAHHSSANTYQKLMGYFHPRLWLGMTATPDKRDDCNEKYNIYEIFHHNIACDIRLQQAMEDNLLCPFHYFGIRDLSLINDDTAGIKKVTGRDFSVLTCDERIKHIVEQATYYGYSGDRVKGLIFCSRIEESEELSRKLNETVNPDTGNYFRTLSLNGSASAEQRQTAFERLAMDEKNVRTGMEPLDYIISVDILNEGVDIVEVNQVLMLRPTQSPIVFIQQLGRGLRKSEGKEYVVILDFIGNYTNNFMIPIALSGDRTYNPDTIRKYVISGNHTIPGPSTIHFDAVARERIFRSIDKIRGMKSIIRESYITLKNRLGRIPYLADFYENGEVDPLVIVHEYKTYQDFLSKMEPDLYEGKITEQEKLTLEYISKTILAGVRPFDLELLKKLSAKSVVSMSEFLEEMKEKYPAADAAAAVKHAVYVLEGHFVSKEEEYRKFQQIEIMKPNKAGMLCRMKSYEERLTHAEFYKQLEDLISVGLRRYQDKYRAAGNTGIPFVLYEKYSRRDVSLLMNCGKDLSSTMYGMKRIGEDVFLFVTYHKEEADSVGKQYVDGKPDYADAFINNSVFRWDSQIGKGPDSGYIRDVACAKRKHLLVKKSDAENSFYYMGRFDIVELKADKKLDNRGKMRDITKVMMHMQHAVREDILAYLESNLTEERK